MANLDIANLLYELADLMEFRGEDAFKVRAYRRAADSISALPEELEDVVREGRLLRVEGIGKSIADKVTEMLHTGTSTHLEELRQAIPPGLRDVTRLPGIGPKTAAALYTRLGVRSLDDLEAFTRQGLLREMPGFGAKKEIQVLAALARLKERRERVPLAALLPLAGAVLEHMRRHPAVTDAAIAGSVRRRKEEVSDLDLVCAATDMPAVMEHFVRMPLGGEVLQQGERFSSVSTGLGRRVDLRLVEPGEFAAALHHFTGSKEYNEQLRALAEDRGYLVNEYGLEERETGARCLPHSEAELYRMLGLPYVAPELREGRGEVEAAAGARLPRLIERADLKGDLHAHTRWSDGMAGAPDMAQAARSLGHRYLAITDHTQALAIANGLSPARVRLQAEEIAKLNRGFTDDFRLLHGTEVDILRDGSLDLPDEVLQELDVVVASVHSHFRMEEADMTERILQALKNPHVDILGHPTGRRLSGRDPYPLDMERVLHLAAKTGTALEINSSPDRLDLSDLNARQAKEQGARLCINTDAHAVPELQIQEFGIGQARRAWIEPGDVVNTLDTADLLRWLDKKKG